ncbi:MAG: hypothetical protein A2945_01250 [Candidatus Liptonbacteria bacterium RIFCSPLOWO2_01_FULL_52_25]|uniref:Uncharacterized protein n=1 Tax=Candidatus Liptonbacteria bacterium RIFCSPLOWO2_01_FULL_52_25 TaxID=1798650 RepID=A0A1G2CE13_9BACT|nr:MAG: hypothetical protein A2945_01250 [Candidatus Liptonbacteria bacterium RIFCSPLOWO2_01_FULL_52_25]
MSYKFIVALLAVALGAFLQVVVGNALGIWVNFALAALITTSFFVGVVELVALILLSIFVLSWQPAPSFEILVFGALPFVVFFIHKRFPFEPWLMSGISILVGVLALSLVFGGSLLWNEPSIFLWDIAASVGFGAVVFWAFRSSANRV